MAQLKSTNITGNLAVTGNVVASKIIANNNSSNEILLSNGTTTSLKTITDGIVNAQTKANNAYSLANDAHTDAASAQSTANTALSNAATAQSTANTALSNAAIADSKAVNAKKAADNADSKAGNAHNYAKKVYGDTNNETPAHTVIGNAAAINALTGTHTQDVQALDKRIDELILKHNNELTAAINQHNLDKVNLQAQIDTKLFNNQDDETTGTLTAKKFIRAAENGIDNTSSLLVADGSVQPKLNFDSNVGESTDYGFRYNTPIITGLTLNSSTNKITAQRRALKDLGINLIYNFKGSMSSAHFKNISSASVGDVYHINDNYPSSGTPILAKGSDWVCHTPLTSSISNNFDTLYDLYWQPLITSIDLSGYLSKSGGFITGSILRNITSSSLNTPMIKLGSANQNVDLFRITNSNGNSALADKSQYGYNLRYTGSASTKNLQLLCDNSTASVQQIGWELNQAGQMGIGMSPNTNYRLTVKGPMYFQFSNTYSNEYIPLLSPIITVKGTKTSSNILQLIDNFKTTNNFGFGITFESGGSTYIGAGESATAIYNKILSSYTDNTQKYKAAEDEILYLCSDTKTYFYTNCQEGETPNITTYDVSGNWTMPRNLILDRGTTNDIAIELLRGTGADWKILSSGGNLAIQCNYTTADVVKSYYPVITMAYNTGNITTRGSILPGTNNTKYLGSASSKWNGLYSTYVYLDIAKNSSGGIINFTSNSKSIGSGDNPWNDLYSTNVHSTTVNLNTAQNSSGGTIDFTSNKNIGSSSNKWNNLYITNIAISGDLHFNNAAKFKYNSADKCIDVIFT